MLILVEHVVMLMLENHSFDQMHNGLRMLSGATLYVATQLKIK
jgi:phospholipase C